MDAISGVTGIGCTLSAADGDENQGRGRRPRGCGQHAGLHAVLHADFQGYIQCRGDTAVQPPHDGGLLGYLPDYPGCLRHRLLACGQLPHRAVALRHALLLCHRQRVLRGCHPARDVAAPAHAGDDGSL